MKRPLTLIELKALVFDLAKNRDRLNEQIKDTLVEIERLESMPKVDEDHTDIPDGEFEGDHSRVKRAAGRQ